jgi:hypothetical protein
MKKKTLYFSHLDPKEDVSCKFKEKIQKKIWTALMGQQSLG